jgi:hypothetical protein
MGVMAAPRVQLPDATGLFKDMQRESEYLASLTQRLSGELSARSRDDSVRASILMQSPGGKVFQLYVTDAGVVTAVPFVQPA